MHAFGDVSSLAEMRDLVRASTRLDTYEPDGDRAPWDDLHGRFTEIVRPKVVT
jgi:hypothetical protein